MNRTIAGFCLLFSLSLLYCGQLSAQFDLRENSIWAFGNYAGLNFTTGNPVAFRSGMANGTIARESNASVCDAAGSFAFCTNGSVIWDRSNTAMPNGNPLHPYAPSSLITNSTTQGALIVPFPDSMGKYYVFSLTQKELGAAAPPGAGKLFYSVVDMTLNGGQGDVVPGRKWILLDSNLTEKMVAVPGDKCNIWLLVHSRDSNCFKAFEISRAGIDPNPAISYSGSYGNVNYWVTGELKASPDRRRLLACAQEGKVAELYDFNPGTGSVSNAMLLDQQNEFYGAAFSPDNSKAYLSAGTGVLQYVFQYNLNAPNPAAIAASRTRIGSCSFSQLRLGPDGKIYFQTDNTSGSLGAIANPNALGTACQFVPAAVSLLFTTGMVAGLPAEVVKVLPPDTFRTYRDTVFCAGFQSMLLEASPGFANYRWDDGTPGPRLRISQPGTYRVRFQPDGCNYAEEIFRVIRPEPVYARKDTGFCQGESALVLQPREEGSSIRWDDSSSGARRTITGPGIYWVTYIRNCRLYTDTFAVGKADLDVSLGGDRTICDGRPLILYVPGQGADFLWEDNSTGSTHTVSASGTCWVKATLDGCTVSDTIRVNFLSIKQDLGPDTMFCNELPFSLKLRANVPGGGTVLWSDGSSEHELLAGREGIWWVTVYAASCSGSDTVRIEGKGCNCIPEIPSAFSPNGDGRNDLFRPLIPAGCVTEDYEMRIYNRWGQTVFTATDPAIGWNGLFRGLPSEQGVYMYTMRYDGLAYKGDVTLIR